MAQSLRVPLRRSRVDSSSLPLMVDTTDRNSVNERTLCIQEQQEVKSTIFNQFPKERINRTVCIKLTRSETKSSFEDKIMNNFLDQLDLSNRFFIRPFKENL